MKNSEITFEYCEKVIESFEAYEAAYVLGKIRGEKFNSGIMIDSPANLVYRFIKNSATLGQINIIEKTLMFSHEGL